MSQLSEIICPLCGSEMEIDFYPHGFHPAEYECPECGYNTGNTEIETLKLFIEQLEVASISGCNSEAMQFRYKMEAKWLNELLKIKEEINMASLVEQMFSVREVPWHKQGLVVEDAPTSEDAIRLAGLDWKVEQKEMYLADGTKIPDAFANVRDKDNRVLGVVGNRYSIVQNSEAFSFTDSLIGEGCQYETAGSLRDGKQIWLLAHLPEAIQIAGDDVMPYLCFTNTHDGTGSVKVFTTGIRVVCNNTLNQALNNAKRTWSVRHTGSIETKLAVATETLNLANNYMAELKKECEELALKPVDKDKVIEFIKFVVPEEDDMSQRQKTNIRDIRNDIWYRYTYAPDLRDRGQNCLRFLNAVSDTVSHKEPTRRTANYDENHFISLISGDKMLDKAYQICKAA